MKIAYKKSEGQISLLSVADSEKVEVTIVVDHITELPEECRKMYLQTLFNEMENIQL
jgi:hypothetical protein